MYEPGAHAGMARSSSSASPVASTRSSTSIRWSSGWVIAIRYSMRIAPFVSVAARVDHVLAEVDPPPRLAAPGVEAVGQRRAARPRDRRRRGGAGAVAVAGHQVGLLVAV